MLAAIVSLVGSAFPASFSITGITKKYLQVQIRVSAFYASGYLSFPILLFYNVPAAIVSLVGSVLAA